MENDLISRKAIRLDISSWLASNTDWRTLGRIIDSQPSVKAEPKWISVKERLPEDDETLDFFKQGNLTFITVLAYVPEVGTELRNRLKVDKCGISAFDEFATDGWVWSAGREPTHWMPLPEPPKMDGGAEDV